MVSLAAGVFGLSACARPAPPATRLDDEPPRIAAAFFGLDDALPRVARLLCSAAPGRDGMPVTFSRRVVEPIDGTIDPAAFVVRTRSGALRTPACATLEPAAAPAERHTVLLIGDLGGEPADPPVAVSVVAPLALAGADARGLGAPVIPLAAGPTLALALSLRPGAIASDCPRGRTAQIVVAIWAGGVTPAPGASQEDHRRGYQVETAAGLVTPFALGDLDDRDNYVHLCLDTAATTSVVRFAAGIVVDPRGDRNPETTVAVSPQR